MKKSRNMLAFRNADSKIIDMGIDGAGKKVLVADDENDTCVFLKRYLERRQMQVVVALDGAEAQRAIKRENFDYFLLDCSMPHLTGLELIEEARSRNPAAKIIMISGFPSVDNEVLQQLGGDLFIHKPIQLSELDQVL